MSPGARPPCRLTSKPATTSARQRGEQDGHLIEQTEELKNRWSISELAAVQRLNTVSGALEKGMS